MTRTYVTALRGSGPLALVALLTTLLAGCQTVSYYSHAALGQWRVMSERRPVDDVLADLAPRRDADPDAARLYRQLTLSQALLDFATERLALEVGDRYRSYVDLQRGAVVWNLFAAPPLSLTPNQWCYPIVGCAPYRGYFDRDYAERRAAALADQDLETYLGPVAAYSTLGWFADPLLSTFIGWPESDLAELLFHELAHGVVWVSGDVAFNESFATFVGRQGLQAWLAAQGRSELLAEWQHALSSRQRLLDLLARTRLVLATVYDSERDVAAKLALKRAILDTVATCYSAHRDRLGGGRYDPLVRGLDNARLVSIATYEDLVPSFRALFGAVSGDWAAFYERVRAIGDLPPARRRAALVASGDEQVAQDGDDQRSEEVECHALAGHLLDGEAAG